MTCLMVLTINHLSQINLLPVELRDVNGAGDADDVTITPWDTSQNIANNNIAWIDAHQSAQNTAPRMPQLEFRVPGLPDGLTIEAKLKVNYDRGNGDRIARNQLEDDVRIPNDSDTGYLEADGHIWSLYNDDYWVSQLLEHGFFGGDATLTYRIKNGNGDIVVGPEEIDFRIGGENPNDDRCKAFIQGKPNAGNNGSMSFMYAVAKHESKAKNTNNLYYNQFYELPRHRRDVGRPVWNNDGGTSPGGYGVFQVTGNSTNNLANIPRKEIWNWQDNVEAAFSILNHNIKSGLAGRFYTDIKNDSAAHLQAFNSCLPPNIVADGKTFSSDKAIWITAYNGWGGPIRNRYVFSRTKPCGLGVTKRWHWNPPLKPSGKTYLTLVAEEIE